MNRRKFLISSAVAVGSLSAGKNIFAGMERNFKLEVITDRPDEALKLFDGFIKKFNYNGVIKFREFEFSGEAFGDIVYVSNGQMIDFKSKKSHGELSEISAELGLPKKLVNPVKLSFLSEMFTGRAKKFVVINNGVVVKELDSTMNTIHHIESETGKNSFEIKNGSAKMISSTCTHKNCLKTGEIKNFGDEIICVPNKIRIVAS